MQTQKKNQYNRGAAMMIFVLFFMFISVAVLVGIVTPTVREFEIVRDNLKSKQAYFLAESGSEDAFYRVKNNKQLSSSEVITLGSDSVTTTITSIGTTEKNIVSVGDSGNNKRTASLNLKTGTGVIFKYGSQAGYGGVKFNNNTGLYGSFYSNGSIIGANNVFITGDAYVADLPASDPDQSNTIPIPPSNNIVFGDTNGTQDVVQSFQLSTPGVVSKIQLYIRKVGNPVNPMVRIVTNSTSNLPTSTVVTSSGLNINLVGTSYSWIDVALTPVQLNSNTTYWLMLDGNTDVNNYYTIGGNSNTYTNGVAKIGQYGGTWKDTSPVGLDLYFKIYLGGLTSKIYKVEIGGDAFANEINDSAITGTPYCQIGSNNNKLCNASKPNPGQVNLPISDSLITAWKNDALTGGTTVGNVVISSPASLGPKKIVGNLTVNSTLTITDTIWVTGNIAINNTVNLNSSYGTSTGIIIADGTVTVNNGVVFENSGQAGSYIMLLSTSVCDIDVVGNPCGSNDAMDIQNNSSVSIVVAPYGAIYFSNNAGVKEVIANRIRLKNGATISYGSGLINITFKSGPLGSWNVSKWNETQ